jgi:acetamidase/formamidase
VTQPIRIFAIVCGFAAVAPAANWYVKATPKTVVIGHYSATTAPVITVKSGDTVEIDRDVKERGPGGHILTGPIAIEGAEPGDTLEVHIDRVTLPVPWAYNSFRSTSGFLPEDFTHSASKLIPLDLQKKVAKFGPGIEIPLRPFFGSMGVAPPPDAGRLNSAPPWMHAGNLDNKELVAGTILYIPVYVKGALFQVGDGHAGQGDGEVDITAMETALNGAFRFVVRKDLHLKWPRAETPTSFIVMGMNEELVDATKQAVREMIEFLVTEKGLSRDDAYMLTSVAGDFAITQLVDGKKGVHGKISKGIFVGK